MSVLPGNASHIGQRQQQQDAFALSDFSDTDFTAHGGYLAVVADGIGGLQNGRLAANIAIAEFISRYLAKPSEQSVEDALDLALDAANQAVLVTANWHGCLQEMGSTLVAAVIFEQHLYWRAVGDSHLYLCRDGRLSQLNADHNFARVLQVQVNEGLMSQNMADGHPNRQALESFLGLECMPFIERNAKPLPLRANDRLLLCSDGVDGVLTADEIIHCLAEVPMLAAQHLCDAVLQKQLPSQDNLTAVVLGYEIQESAKFNKAIAYVRNPWLIFSIAGLLLLSAYQAYLYCA